VLPGRYQVQLTVDGQVAGTRSVRVSRDPLLRIDAADLKTLHDTALMLHELQGVMDQAGTALDSATAQVHAARAALDSAAGPHAALVAAADSVATRLGDMKQRLGEPPRFGFGRGGGSETTLRSRASTLTRELGSWTALPTAAQLREAGGIHDDLAGLVSTLNEVLATQLPALYHRLAAAGVEAPPHGPIDPVVMR
jgi:hypothetical protein